MCFQKFRDIFKANKKAEDIYFRGGKTKKLKKRLRGIQKQLKKAFVGKTILGSSAGALFLARYYYSQGDTKIFRGFNILPIKIITHYLSKDRYAPTSGKEKLEMLKKYKEKLPTYAISETEFIILKK